MKALVIGSAPAFAFAFAFAFALALGLALAPAAFAQSGHDSGGHGGGRTTSNGEAVAASGTVDAVDAASRKLTLSHGPIKALGWPSMTMDFAVADNVDLSSLKPGAEVDFTLTRGADGLYMIDSLTK